MYEQQCCGLLRSGFVAELIVAAKVSTFGGAAAFFVVILVFKNNETMRVLCYIISMLPVMTKMIERKQTDRSMMDKWVHSFDFHCFQ